MEPVKIRNPRASTPLVLSCEHASCEVPEEYASLGLPVEALQEHIAWDIGARHLTAVLAERFSARAVCSGVSRLVIDCNRDLGDDDLIVTAAHGVAVPGNAAVAPLDRRRRIERFYAPYHQAIDEVLAGAPCDLLISVHSFTPALNGQERRFDVGVLYDSYEADARRLGAALATAGLAVRYNEPYSAFDGLIFSARSHGLRHGVRYLEIEINNRLLRDQAAVSRIGAAVARAVEEVLASPCASC